MWNLSHIGSDMRTEESVGTVESGKNDRIVVLVKELLELEYMGK